MDWSWPKEWSKCARVNLHSKKKKKREKKEKRRKKEKKEKKKERRKKAQAGNEWSNLLPKILTNEEREKKKRERKKRHRQWDQVVSLCGCDVANLPPGGDKRTGNRNANTYLSRYIMTHDVTGQQRSLDLEVLMTTAIQTAL